MEYGLIVAIIIGVIIGAVWGLGGEVAVTFDHVQQGNTRPTWYTPGEPGGPVEPIDPEVDPTDQVDPTDPTSAPGDDQPADTSHE
jgi:hypothetical protein